MQDHMASGNGVQASPDLFIGNNICLPKYDVGDSQQFSFHPNHDWVLNQDCLIHVHWSHKALDELGGSQVTFQLELTHTKGYNDGVYHVPILLNVIATVPATRYGSSISEIQLSAAGGASGTKLISSPTRK